MKKLITFCLFGNKEIFNVGAIRNIELAEKIYPDWICRFYIFSENLNIVEKLEKYSNVECVKIGKEGGFWSTLYRFLPLEERDVEFFISRDCDSRLSLREKNCVDEWISSDKICHIIRDHPYHYTPDYPILAGMCGFKGGIIDNIRNYMSKICQNFTDEKGIDQKFLYHLYHTYFKNNSYVNEDNNFSLERNFERDKIYFIGQPINEKENFYGDWENDLKMIGINNL